MERHYFDTSLLSRSAPSSLSQTQDRISPSPQHSGCETGTGATENESLITEDDLDSSRCESDQVTSLKANVRPLSIPLCSVPQSTEPLIGIAGDPNATFGHQVKAAHAASSTPPAPHDTHGRDSTRLDGASSTEELQRAIRESGERLRLLQLAEVAVLRRLRTCVASLFSDSAPNPCPDVQEAFLTPSLSPTNEGECSVRDLCDISPFEAKGSGSSLRDSGGAGVSTGHLCSLRGSSSVCHEGTREVWLPTLKALSDVGTRASLLVQVHRHRVPTTGLTVKANTAYDALRDLLQNHHTPQQHVSPVSTTAPLLGDVSLTSSVAAQALRLSQGSSIGVPHSSNTCSREVTSKETKGLLDSVCSGVADEQHTGASAESLADRLLTRSIPPTTSISAEVAAGPAVPIVTGQAEGHGATVSLHIAESPLQSTSTHELPQSALPLARCVTPSSSLGDSDDDGVYFPTPPRKTGASKEAVSKARPNVPLDEALPVTATFQATLRAACRFPVPEPRAQAPLALDDVAVSSSAAVERISGIGKSVWSDEKASNTGSLSSATMPLSSSSVSRNLLSSRLTASTSVAAPLPRAEMTATDILATINALPPPPSKLVGSRGVRRQAKGPKKRHREDEHEERLNKLNVEHTHSGPLEGLPCLGVDVEAAATAEALRGKRRAPHTLKSGSVVGQRGSDSKVPSGASVETRATQSPPQRGYVRTRQQRADDVAQAEAIVQAVRRAAGAVEAAGPLSGVAGWDASNSDISQASQDSLQHTPAQYWDIDFP